MSRLACPYCYHRINGNRLWFQCTGRGAPGFDGCKIQNDPDRARETGVKEQALPVFAPPSRVRARQVACPACHGVTGRRTCPCCHTPLAQNFGASKSPLIAMVGAKGTGKTVYLSALAHELRHELRRRFDADVRLIAKPKDFNVDTIRAGALFAQTEQAKDGRSEPVLFEWRQQESRLAGLVSRYKTTYLSFYDTAGEDLTDQKTAQDLTYLRAADALILLLDPFMIPQARHLIKIPESAIQSSELTVEVVNRVTETLREAHGISPRRNVKIPVAVAFAKIDAFFDVLGADHPLLRTPPPSMAYDETAGQATHEYVRAMLDQWGADDIDTHFRLNYRNFRYFAVSSLGAQPDYEAALDAAPVSAAGVQPFRVEEPLVWLLSRFNVVPRTEQR